MTFLEKIAAKINFSQSDIEEEKRLIERVQKYSDPIAMSQLLIKYRGTIRQVVVASGLNSAVDDATALQMAQNEFARIVKDKVDLKSANKPNTYIYTALKGALMNAAKDNRPSMVWTSQSNREYDRYVDIATTYLKKELQRDPTDEEIFKYIKKNMASTGGKGLTLAVVKRLRKYKIDEWSGNKVLAKDNDAENITFEDIYNVSSKTPADILNMNSKEKAIENEISVFTANINEQRFLKQIYGLGLYKNNRVSKNRAAVNNGITNFLGDKLLRQFKEHLQKKGILR